MHINDHTDKPAARDLPVGSRIRYDGIDIVRRDPGDPLCSGWRGDDGSSWRDVEIDWILDDGAVVAIPADEKGA